MHNPVIYRRKFSGLIMTVFGTQQTLEWKPEIEMYQTCDCPERWEARPAGVNGRSKWQASSPAILARIIEESFVDGFGKWEIVRPAASALRRQQPTNIIEFRPRRRA